MRRRGPDGARAAVEAHESPLPEHPALLLGHNALGPPGLFGRLPLVGLCVHQLRVRRRRLRWRRRTRDVRQRRLCALGVLDVERVLVGLHERRRHHAGHVAVAHRPVRRSALAAAAAAAADGVRAAALRRRTARSDRLHGHLTGRTAGPLLFRLRLRFRIMEYTSILVHYTFGS